MPAHQIEYVSDEKATIAHRQYSQDTLEPKIEEGVPVGIWFLAVLQPVLLEQRRQFPRYAVEMLDLKARRSGGRALQAFELFPCEWFHDRHCHLSALPQGLWENGFCPASVWFSPCRTPT